MFAALGSEAHFQILRAVLAAHPEGLVLGDIRSELDIAPSTWSHHLEKLKNEDLITLRRGSIFLRYTVNTKVLKKLLVPCHRLCPLTLEPPVPQVKDVAAGRMRPIWLGRPRFGLLVLWGEDALTCRYRPAAAD